MGSSMNIDITTDGKNITLAAVIPARDAKALDQLIRAIKSANVPYAVQSGGVELIGGRA